MGTEANVIVKKHCIMIYGIRTFPPTITPFPRIVIPQEIPPAQLPPDSPQENYRRTIPPGQLPPQTISPYEIPPRTITHPRTFPPENYP